MEAEREMMSVTSAALCATSVQPMDRRDFAETEKEETVSRWYAAQTGARHEKKVAQQLNYKGISSFLPLYEKNSRWKDRRVRLQVPVFAGYVFVRFRWEDRLRVLKVPGIVRLVSFGGNAVAVPDQEIQSIRASLGSGLNVKPAQYLAVGQRVRIRSGSLEGCEGYLVRRKGSCRLIISVSLIQRSVAVEIDAQDVSLHTCPSLEFLR